MAKSCKRRNMDITESIMAILKTGNVIKGVELNYVKIGSITATKNEAVVSLLHCVDEHNEHLSGKTLALTLEESKALGDILVKAAYDYLKETGKLTGEDC